MQEQLLTAVEIKVIDDASKALDAIKQRFMGLNDGIQKQQSFLNKYKAQLATVSKQATITGVAILGAAGLAVQAAREQQRANKQLDAVLLSTKGAAGITADEVKRLAGEYQNVTNFADEVIQSGQNVLLQYTNLGKDVFPAATEAMLNMSEVMGTDVESSARLVGKALQDPVRGVDALNRAGVRFTDQQKNMVESLVKSGKVIEAQKFLIQGLEKQFGGTARALADPITQLKNQVSEVAEEIGTALLPVVQDLAKQIIPVVQKMAQWIKEHPQLTSNIAKAVVALGAILAVLGSIGLIIPKVIAGISALKAIFLGTIPVIKAVGVALLAVNPLLLALAVATGILAVLVGKRMAEVRGAWEQTAGSASENTSRMMEQYNRWQAASEALTGREQEYAKIRMKMAYHLAEAVRLSEAQIEQYRLGGTEAAIQGFQEQMDFHNKMVTKLGEEALDYQKSHNVNMKKVQGAYKDVGKSAQGAAGAVGGASGSMKEDTEKLKEAVSDLRDEYYDMVVDVNKRLLALKTEHTKTMKSLEKELGDVNTAIKRLNKEYKDSMAELVEAHNDALSEMGGEKADELVEQFNKIKELQEEIAGWKLEEGALTMERVVNVVENRQDKGATLSAKDQVAYGLTSQQAEQVNTVLELRREQEALVKVLRENYEITKEQAEALDKTTGETQLANIKKIIDGNKELSASYNFAGLTDIEKAFTGIKEKTEEENKDFKKNSTEKKESYNEELGTMRKARDEIKGRMDDAKLAYESERGELLKVKISMQEMHDSYTGNLANLNKVTEETVESMKKKLEELRKTIGSIDALLQQKAAITGGQTITQKAKAPVRSAKGGVFHERTLTEIAEAGQSEAVVPLPDGRSIPVILKGGEKKAGDINITISHVEMNNEADVQFLFEQLARKLKLYQLRSA